VIVPPSGVRVLVATKPVDFRKGIDGLAALVQEHLRLDPYAGTIYVFRAKRADRVKLLIWDGSGLVMVYKRLEDGRFRWPSVEDGVMRLSPAQFSALIEGLDWRRVHARRVAKSAILPGWRCLSTIFRTISKRSRLCSLPLMRRQTRLTPGLLRSPPKSTV
jgi:transposase